MEEVKSQWVPSKRILELGFLFLFASQMPGGERLYLPRSPPCCAAWTLVPKQQDHHPCADSSQTVTQSNPAPQGLFISGVLLQ